MSFWSFAWQQTTVAGGGVDLETQEVVGADLNVSDLAGVTLGVSGPEVVRLDIPADGGVLTVDLLNIDLDSYC